MSLINQMLMDLDRRTETAASPPGAAAVLEGLRPSAPGVGPAALNIKWAAALLVLLAGVGIAGYFGWSRMEDMAQATGASHPAPVAAAPVQRFARSAPPVPRPEPVLALPVDVTPSAVAEPSPPVIVEETAQVQPPRPPTPPPVTPRPVAVFTPPAPPPAPIPLLAKPAPPADAQALYQQGVQALAQEQSRAAEEHFLAALEVEPAHLAARKALLELALRAKDMGLLRRRLDAGAHLWPQQPPLRLFAARLYVETGDERAALSLLEQGGASEVKEADHLGLRAVIHQRLGHHPEAMRDFTAALDLKPSESRWWMGLALSAEASADPTTAMRAYQRVTQMGGEKALIDYARKRLAVLTTAALP